MKIIVTGGAGFIGSAVCRHLIGNTAAHVVNVDKLTYAANLRSLDPIAHSRRAWWEPLRKGVYAGERLGLVPVAAQARAG